MPRKLPASLTRCRATTVAGIPCPRWAKREGWCRNHDPEEAEARSKRVTARHPRFDAPKTRVGDQDFDRAKVPTIAKVADMLLDRNDDLKAIATRIDRGELDPKRGTVMVSALRGSKDALKAVSALLYNERKHVQATTEQQRKVEREALEREHREAREGSTRDPSAESLSRQNDAVPEIDSEVLGMLKQ